MIWPLPALFLFPAISFLSFFFSLLQVHRLFHDPYFLWLWLAVWMCLSWLWAWLAPS